MSRAYSLDLRERVVKALTAGQSCRTAAARFGVSVATVVRWGQRQRRTGSPAASRVGGYRPYVLAGERAWLLRRIGEKPDLTLRAIQAEPRSRGIKVSYYAVWHFFEHGIGFAPRADGGAPPRDREPDLGQARSLACITRHPYRISSQSL